MPVRIARRIRISIVGIYPHLPRPPLAVPMIFQEQTNWCWAACAEMVASYYGKQAPQCESANYLFGRNDCCNLPSSGPCNKPIPDNDPGAITRVYSHWGIQSQINYPVSYEVLESEMASSRPVELAFLWNSGGGHAALVIQTFLVLWFLRWIRVNDPWYGQGAVPFDSLGNYLGLGCWAGTWTGITPAI